MGVPVHGPEDLPAGGMTRRERSLLLALTTRGGRKRSGCCRCEGVRAVRELMEHAADLVKFVAVTERALEQLPLPEPLIRRVSEEELARCSETVSPQGVIAVAEIPPEAAGEPEGEFILAFDQLNDPGNFGTIVRTFRAVGGRELWYTKGSVDPWCDKAVRSGMGAQFALRTRRFDDLLGMREFGAAHGYERFFYADPHQGEICFTAEGLFDRSILLIGGEANGAGELPPGSRRVMIPMPGNFESLNAAQAATVLLVESVRRRSMK